jgi:hypothetical protein
VPIRRIDRRAWAGKRESGKGVQSVEGVAVEARVEDFLSSIVSEEDARDDELETVQFAIRW